MTLINLSLPRLLGAVCLLLLSASPLRAQEPARSADSFVDSIGVATHWGYPDTPYGFAYDKVKVLLGGLGIRNVRDGYHPREEDLYKTFGIKTTMIFGPGQSPAQAVALLKDHIALISMVEGPNEVDLFAQSANYQGQGFPQGPKHYQDDLYAAVKADPVTAHLPVISFSLGLASPLKVAPVHSFDYEVMHSYAGGQMPSVSLEGGVVSNIANANRIVGPGAAIKPIVVTESGYHTALGGSGVIAGVQPGVSEKAQAKYLPRQFAEYFNAGIVRDFAYEFVDEFPDYGASEREATNAEACFGVVKRDLTPKPAFYAEKNLIGLLKEARWNASAQRWDQPAFAPGALAFTLTGQTANVHHTLLQKSNGDFYLLLWQEVPSFATRTKQDIANPPVTVTLTPDVPLKSAAVFGNVFTPPSGIVLTQAVFRPKTLMLKVPDEVIIVRLTPDRRLGNKPLASPTALTANTTGTTVTLGWRSAPKAAGFFVWRMGRFLGRAQKPSFADANLVPGTGYTYTVAAYNAKGDVSPAVSVLATTRETYPDLVVTDLTWTPSHPKVGDAMTFTATIKNQGIAPTPGGVTHGIAFQVDGVNVNWSDTSSEPLAPGQSRTLTANNGAKGMATWTLTPGTHAIAAYVDDVNRITESDETNNTLTKTLSAP